MLYRLLKIKVRLAMIIFCRRILVNKPELLKTPGPLLLACNHPNSFLDGVLLDALFKQPLFSLARGDVFKKPLHAKLLTALNLLPVYRISEGAENLTINYDTFNTCKDIFLENGIVIIFSEGKCINEWHLRPLKKGTARLAVMSWKENIPLRILPIGINYSSFRRFGKNIYINIGEMIEKRDFNLQRPDGILHQSFNDLLETQLKGLVFEIGKDDREKQRRILKQKPSPAKKILLSVPALLGYVCHWPLYIPIKRFTLNRTSHNDHYDSVLTGILLFAYPFYLLFLSTTAFLFTGCLSGFGLVLVMPFLAWSYVQLKPQLDR